MGGHKTKNKKLVSFSVDEETLRSFNKLCKQRSINKSLFIQNFMKAVLGTPEDLKYYLENYGSK
jgi:hypothetical protein